MQRQYTRINKEWHRGNRMQKNPLQQERIKWHLAHAKHCACRPIPEKLMKTIDSQRTKNQEQGTKA